MAMRETYGDFNGQKVCICRREGLLPGKSVQINKPRYHLETGCQARRRASS